MVEGVKNLKEDRRRARQAVAQVRGDEGKGEGSRVVRCLFGLFFFSDSVFRRVGHEALAMGARGLFGNQAVAGIFFESKNR